MPLNIVRNDITKMEVDAVVNAANCTLLGGGGVDGCIHRAAGPELLRECETLGGCETGNAKITKGYNLPCKFVIHTVGPRWINGKHGEPEKLKSCYLNSLELAKQNGCESVAFPLISSGIYGYPKEKAFKTAVDVIGDFLIENEMTVYIVVFDKKAFITGSKLYSDIAEYIDDRYVDKLHSADSRVRQEREISFFNEPAQESFSLFETDKSLPQNDADVCCETEFFTAAPKCVSLSEAVSQIDESFSEMLLRKIDESGMTDVECYKKANISRKLFSKIRSDKLYKPSKPTVIAFGIALELSLDEMKDMLMKAGFALSHSNKFDIIIEFFIHNNNYNIFEINEALFAFDQSLLGA